jgi:trehalose/maltose hydrolase-like predicted phosphorylase
MGVMSGTLDLLQRSFLGNFVADGLLRFEPRLLDRLDGLVFSMRFRGTSLGVGIKGDELTVHADSEGFRGPMRVAVDEDVRELGPGQECAFRLAAQASSVRP